MKKNNVENILNEPEIRENKRLVDETIQRLLPEKHSIHEINLLYQMMKDYPSRPAKSLRSSVCLLTCQAYGGTIDKALITASSLDLFQNWILIHDDVEDQSELRRGGPALHHKYTIPLAINAGDALHGKMWSFLYNNRDILDNETTLLVINEFLNMLNETTEGQHMELSWVHENQWNIKQDDYLIMCKKKTAWYTCITPCRLGNLIATNTDLNKNDFVNFGEDLGIAFQIRDDILNLIAGTKYGKESAGDLIEGKRTLILIHLLESASTQDRENVENILGGNRQMREQNYKTILELIHKYNSLQFATEIADKFSLSALTEFDKIFDQLPDSRSKLLLRNITEYIVSRDW